MIRPLGVATQAGADALLLAPSIAWPLPLPLGLSEAWIAILRRGELLAMARQRLRLADSPHARSAAREATPSEAADRADIAACLRGDGDAFARLVERHQQAVGRLMQRFARDHATRETLVQDTFVEAWQSLSSYRGDAPFLHWLRVLATRVGYRHWREQARRRVVTPVDELAFAQVAALPDTRLDAQDAARVVHALLARLSPRDRLVLTLLHLEGCAVEEIARLTGWSRVMVKVQAHRARKRLAALLPPESAPGRRDGR